MKGYAQLTLLLLLFMAMFGGLPAEHSHADCAAALCHANHTACAHTQDTTPALRAQQCRHHHLPCIHLSEGDSLYSPGVSRSFALISKAPLPHFQNNMVQRSAVFRHSHESHPRALPLLLPMLC